METTAYLFFSFLCIVAGYAASMYVKNRRFWMLMSKIKGDKSLPILGNGLQIGRTSEDILRNLERIWNDCGKSTFKLIFPGSADVFISDPGNVELLLSNSKEISKTLEYSFLKRWLGDGLILSKGEKWRTHRKILTPTFHFKILEQFINVFNKKAAILMEKLSENVDKVFDVYPFITLYTLDIISESAMGVSIDAQNDSKSDIVQATYSICSRMHRRSYNAWKRIEFLYKLTSDYRQELKDVEIIHSFSEKVIASRKILMKNEIERNNNLKENEALNVDEVAGQKKKLAFLDLLLLSRMADGGPLSDTCIKDEVTTFMFAGHDTTSSAISFALYNLAHSPVVQQKAYEEQQAVMRPGTQDVTYEQLHEMKYLELVIRESLRMFPPVPLYGRELRNDLPLPDGTIIPGGCTVSIFYYAMAKNPKYIPNPEVFNPDNFHPDNTKNRSPYLFVPFSAGPRNCIGQKFAMLEMKSTLSWILRTFELLPVPKGFKPVLCAEVILKSKNGINIMLKKRT